MSPPVFCCRGPLPGDLPDSAGDDGSHGHHAGHQVGGGGGGHHHGLQHPPRPGLCGGHLELQPGGALRQLQLHLQQPRGGRHGAGLRARLLAGTLRDDPHRPHRRQHGRLYRHHNLRQPPRHRQLRRGQADQTTHQLLYLLAGGDGRVDRDGLDAFLYSEWFALL